MTLSARFERHRPLVADAEQSALSECVVGVAGLGVGGAVVQQLGLAGVGAFRISDSDVVSASNLNRHPIAVATDVGAPKTAVVASYLMRLDAGIKVKSFEAVDSVTAASEFVTGTDVLIEEVDTWQTKWDLRAAAKAQQIPVVSGTDLWASVLIDIERFDAEPERPPFHGLIDPSTPQRAALEILYRPWCTPDFWDVAHTRAGGFPQLGSTMAVASGIVTNFVRSIALGHKVESGRHYFNPTTTMERIS